MNYENDHENIFGLSVVLELKVKNWALFLEYNYRDSLVSPVFGSLGNRTIGKTALDLVL